MVSKSQISHISRLKPHALDSMQASTLKAVPHLWLSLLMIFVLSVIVVSPDCLAEIQPQQIELKSEGERNSSEDGKPIAGPIVMEPVTNWFLSLSSILLETLPLLIGSDAYPSSILHGPPLPA